MIGFGEPGGAQETKGLLCIIYDWAEVEVTIVESWFGNDVKGLGDGSRIMGKGGRWFFDLGTSGGIKERADCLEEWIVGNLQKEGSKLL